MTRYFRVKDRASFVADLQSAGVEHIDWWGENKVFESDQVLISWIGVPEGKVRPRVNVIEKNDFKIDINEFTSITGEFEPETPIEIFAL